MEVAKCSLPPSPDDSGMAHKQEDERKKGKKGAKRMESWRQTRDSKVSNGDRNTTFGMVAFEVGGGSTIPLPMILNVGV